MVKLKIDYTVMGGVHELGYLFSSVPMFIRKLYYGTPENGMFTELYNIRTEHLGNY